MLTHRRQREAQILKQIAQGTSAIAEMVVHMYKGLDPRLHGAAGRSVLAHLIDLQDRGKVVADGDYWQLSGNTNP
jgi:Beta-lactamase associated winged helix domain